MIDFQPNSYGKVYISFVDNGKPTVGATVKITVVNPAGTTIVNAQAATDEGSGKYSYTLSSTHLATVGTYFVTWNMSAPSVIERKAIFTVGYESSFQETLLDIRHDVSLLVEGKDGFFKGTVDSAISTTLVDNWRIEPTDSLRGFYAYIYAGTAQGQLTRVTANNESSGTLTVIQWGVTPVAGDLYELHKYFDIDQINRAIQLAQSTVDRQVMANISDNSLTILSSTYEYSIPPGFSHLYKVEVDTGSGVYIRVSPACWDIVRNTRKLKLHPNVVAEWQDNKLRLSGLRPPVALLNDMVGIDIRPMYLIKKAAAHLCALKMSGRDNEPGGWSTKHQLFEAEAMREETYLNKPMYSNTKVIED